MLRTKFDSNGNMVARVIQGKGDRAPAAWVRAATRFSDVWLTWVKVFSAVQFVTLPQLAAMGHPYARAHFRGATAAQRRGGGARAAPPMPAYHISKQSGQLYGGWHARVVDRANRISVEITNDAKHFGYLSKGTKRMISRPILQVALARAHESAPGIFEDAQKEVHGYSNGGGNAPGGLADFLANR